MADHTKCTGPVGFHRRSVVQCGVLGAFGFTLADFFRAQAYAGEVRSAAGGAARLAEGPAKSVIQIYLPGGLAHQESWDPKPEAPIEYRGPLGVVKTKLPGVVFSENLAKTAQIADKITVVRSLTGRIPDHAQATYQMFTGYLPSAAIQHPSIGAVVANQFGPRNSMPAYVGVPRVPEQGGTGYLSSKFGAFELGGDLSQKNFKVRDMALPGIFIYEAMRTPFFCAISITSSTSAVSPLCEMTRRMSFFPNNSVYSVASAPTNEMAGRCAIERS